MYENINHGLFNKIFGANGKFTVPALTNNITIPSIIAKSATPIIVIAFRAANELSFLPTRRIPYNEKTST
ncbi:unnamed protein product, partial [marine sediment metagenome]